MKTTKELFEDGSMLIRDYKGHEQMLMNEGTFIAIVDETIKEVKNNIVLPDVRGQLIAFLRQQTKLHYVSIYENDFEFADKILKAINLPYRIRHWCCEQRRGFKRTL